MPAGTRMLQRRGTAAEWTSSNPILAAGEIGYALDTHSMRIGDGTSHWDDLPDFNGPEGPQGEEGPAGPPGIDGIGLGDSGWTTFPDQNGWQAVNDSLYHGFELRKDGMGFVHLRGAVQRVSGTNSIIGAIPAGYHSDENIYMGVLGNDMNMHILEIVDSLAITNSPLPSLGTILLINTSYYSGF